MSFVFPFLFWCFGVFGFLGPRPVTSFSQKKKKIKSVPTGKKSVEIKIVKQANKQRKQLNRKNRPKQDPRK